MPLYEYTCRHCGTRTERMRKVSERLSGPECTTCGQPTALVMSAPGMVGAGGGSADAPASWGDSCSTGGCCGGGACGPSLN